MQSRFVRSMRLIPRLGTMLAGAVLALLLFATGAHAAPGQTAVATSGNFSAQHANQSQDTKTIAVPITALSGNAVSVLGHGNTTANNFSGVVVAPSQSSTQRSSQVSSAHASNKSHGSSKSYGSKKGYDSGKSHGNNGGDSQQAYAASGNYNSQSADQRQDTYTVAVPVTILSGNAISVLGKGDTQANNFSGVVVAPSQSSVQSSKQSSSASAENTSKHATHKHGKGGSGKHSAPNRAVASSHNVSSQHVTQRQKTATVAVPLTIGSGNVLSIGGGKTSSHNNSGVVVAPSQSSSQHSTQLSGASADNVAK